LKKRHPINKLWGHEYESAFVSIARSQTEPVLRQLLCF